MSRESLHLSIFCCLYSLDTSWTLPFAGRLTIAYDGGLWRALEWVGLGIEIKAQLIYELGMTIKIANLEV